MRTGARALIIVCGWSLMSPALPYPFEFNCIEYDRSNILCCLVKIKLHWWHHSIASPSVFFLKTVTFAPQEFPLPRIKVSQVVLLNKKILSTLPEERHYVYMINQWKIKQKSTIDETIDIWLITKFLTLHDIDFIIEFPDILSIIMWVILRLANILNDRTDFH